MSLLRSNNNGLYCTEPGLLLSPPCACGPQRAPPPPPRRRARVPLCPATRLIEAWVKASCHGGDSHIWDATYSLALLGTHTGKFSLNICIYIFFSAEGGTLYTQWHMTSEREITSLSKCGMNPQTAVKWLTRIHPHKYTITNGFYAPQRRNHQHGINHFFSSSSAWGSWLWRAPGLHGALAGLPLLFPLDVFWGLGGGREVLSFVFVFHLLWRTSWTPEGVLIPRLPREWRDTIAL